MLVALQQWSRCIARPVARYFQHLMSFINIVCCTQNIKCALVHVPSLPMHVFYYHTIVQVIPTL